jgi:hypothetical protein
MNIRLGLDKYLPSLNKMFKDFTTPRDITAEKKQASAILERVACMRLGIKKGEYHSLFEKTLGMVTSEMMKAAQNKPNLYLLEANDLFEKEKLKPPRTSPVPDPAAEDNLRHMMNDA